MSDNQQDNQNRTPDPEGERRPIAPEILAEAARRAEEVRLTGIGGWLITYIVFQCLNALSFLVGLGGGSDVEEISRFDPLLAADVERVESIATLMGGCSMLGIAACFFLMFNRKKAAQQGNIILLAAQSVFACLVISMMFNTLGGLLEDAERSILGIGVAVQVLLNILWLLYFLKSRRVELTFTR